MTTEQMYDVTTYKGAWMETTRIKSVSLHLSPDPDFVRRGYGKRVKSLGGRYSHCRGYCSTRFVSLSIDTEQHRRLIDDLLREFPGRSTIPRYGKSEAKLGTVVIFHNGGVKLPAGWTVQHAAPGESIETVRDRWLEHAKTSGFISEKVTAYHREMVGLAKQETESDERTRVVETLAVDEKIVEFVRNLRESAASESSIAFSDANIDAICRSTVDRILRSLAS